MKCFNFCLKFGQNKKVQLFLLFTLNTNSLINVIFETKTDSLSEALQRTSIATNESSTDSFSVRKSSLIDNEMATVESTLSSKRILPRPDTNGPGQAASGSSVNFDSISGQRSSLYTSSNSNVAPPTYPKPVVSNHGKLTNGPSDLTTGVTSSYMVNNDPNALYATVNSNRSSNNNSSNLQNLKNKKSVVWANKLTNGPADLTFTSGLFGNEKSYDE